MRMTATIDNINSVEKTIDRISINIDDMNIRNNKIEDFLEETKDRLNKIEKKLETWVENEELRIVNNRFDDYVNNVKFQQLNNKLVKYAKNDFVFDLKAKIEALEKTMTTMASIKHVDKEMMNVIEDFNHKMEHLVTKKHLGETIHDNNEIISKVKTSMKTEHKQIEDIKNSIATLNEHLKKRIRYDEFQDESTKVWRKFDTFNEFIKFEHLQNHIDTISPLISDCKKCLDQYKTDNKDIKNIVGRFDEVLLEKASKFTVESIADKLKQFSTTRDLHELKQLMLFKHSEFEIMINKAQDICNDNFEKVSGKKSKLSFLMYKIYER